MALLGATTLLLLFPVSCMNLDVQDDYTERLELEKTALEEYMSENYPGVEAQPSGLYYIETLTGTGDTAQFGDVVRVDYTGYFLDGSMFDSSMDTAAIRGDIYVPSRIYEPIEFELGYSNLIYGFQEGVSLMREGGRARVIFPSSLGYGRGVSGIPSNSTLIFDLYLREIE